MQTLLRRNTQSGGKVHEMQGVREKKGKYGRDILRMVTADAIDSVMHPFGIYSATAKY